MRRYLSSQFPSAFGSASPSSHTPDAPPTDRQSSSPLPSPRNAATATTQTPAAPPALSLACASTSTISTSTTATNSTAASDQSPSNPNIDHPPAAHKSYVPSLPIPIPSMRKYLFSSNTAHSPADPPSQDPESPAADKHSHFPHIRRKLSNHSDHANTPAASGANLEPSATTPPDHHSNAPASTTPSNVTTSASTLDSQSIAPTPPHTPLHELSQLIEKALGPVGNLYSSIKSHHHHHHPPGSDYDKLLVILHRSPQDRDRILSQFLRARHENANEALQMIMSCLKWRNQINITKYLKHSKQNMLSSSACFPMTLISTPAQTKQPVIYGLIRLLDKRKAQKSDFQNALISFLEASYYGEPYVNDEMIIILDFRDWSIRKNTPYRLVKDGIQTLQDYYPERLNKVFLVNYPTTIKAAYTVISPIIDAGAKEKIVWIPDADPSNTLRKHISAKSIPSFLGGELQAEFPPSWPDIEAEFMNAKASSSYSSGFPSLMSLK